MECNHNELSLVSGNHRRKVALTCRRGSHGSTYLSKSPSEAWKSARILRAVPNCRLILMMSYHLLSPALSVEENGLMAYLQAPPDAGQSITQVTTGLQNWKCAGRRLVELRRRRAVFTVGSAQKQKGHF